MKKAFMLLSCAAAITIAACFLTSGLQRQGKNLSASSDKSMSSYFTANAPSSQENSSAQAVQASKTDVYVVKAYNGHIGVFRNDETKPFREYDTDVLVLPKADQADLQKGRTARTMAEVEKMVEDYDG